jgi:hypothetical protein
MWVVKGERVKKEDNGCAKRDEMDGLYGAATRGSLRNVPDALCQAADVPHTVEKLPLFHPKSTLTSEQTPSDSSSRPGILGIRCHDDTSCNRKSSECPLSFSCPLLDDMRLRLCT